MYQNSPSLLWELLLLRDVVGLMGGEGRGDLDHAVLPASYSSRHRRPCALLPGLGPSSLLGWGGGESQFKSREAAGAQRGDMGLLRLPSGSGDANGQRLPSPAARRYSSGLGISWLMPLLGNYPIWRSSRRKQSHEQWPQRTGGREGKAQQGGPGRG